LEHEDGWDGYAGNENGRDGFPRPLKQDPIQTVGNEGLSNPVTPERSSSNETTDSRRGIRGRTIPYQLGCTCSILEQRLQGAPQCDRGCCRSNESGSRSGCWESSRGGQGGIEAGAGDRNGALVFAAVSESN